jgi:hypothetical protein
MLPNTIILQLLLDSQTLQIVITLTLLLSQWPSNKRGQFRSIVYTSRKG